MGPPCSSADCGWISATRLSKADTPDRLFDLAMRRGKHLGQADQRPVLPPMPSPAYANLTDDDLAAIWAYLRSLPAIANAAPPSAPAPPPAG